MHRPTPLVTTAKCFLVSTIIIIGNDITITTNNITITTNNINDNDRSDNINDDLYASALCIYSVINLDKYIFYSHLCVRHQ